MLDARNERSQRTMKAGKLDCLGCARPALGGMGRRWRDPAFPHVRGHRVVVIETGISFCLGNRPDLSAGALLRGFSAAAKAGTRRMVFCVRGCLGSLFEVFRAYSRQKVLSSSRKESRTLEATRLEWRDVTRDATSRQRCSVLRLSSSNSWQAHQSRAEAGASQLW
jgi:hypothetical protein